jgi:hypothetical protein
MEEERSRSRNGRKTRMTRETVDREGDGEDGEGGGAVEGRSRTVSIRSSLAEERMRGMEKSRSMQMRALTVEMRTPSERESRMLGQGP